MNFIKYSKPAAEWQEALPIGNGHMGVMTFGDLQKETLCFNDATLWSSYPHSDDKENGFQDLQKVRALILNGKNHKADLLAEEKLSGGWSATYLPLGNIYIEMDGLHTDGYQRKLDFENAIHTVTANGVNAQIFASYPKNVVVYRMESDHSFHAKITAESVLRHKVTVDTGLTLFGNAPDRIFPRNHDAVHGDNVRYDEHKAMAYALRLEVVSNGQILYNRDNIEIVDANEMTIYFVTSTGYKAFHQMPETNSAVLVQQCKQKLRNLAKEYDAIRAEHIADFSQLYHKQMLTICEDCDLTTDKIIQNARAGGSLEVLSQMMYNMGKYMLISGSRVGSQPLNLQGIWNREIRPPWSCNYTTNINTQMNYWAASNCGLSTCIEPLIRMMKEAMTTGGHTAKAVFGAEGFCCNHNMDIWRKTSPSMGSARWFLSPLCGAWLTNELYKHYLQGELNEYRDTIFTIVQENAKFLMSYLIKYEGKYAICPSSSPENAFRLKLKPAALDIGTAYDMAIVRESLHFAYEICEDSVLKAKIKTYIEQLYPIQKGRHGIREYHKKYMEYEPGHRHFSPLYAFYPGNEIGYYADPKRTQWVRELFWRRLNKSHQHIGWSAVWAMCIGARLRDVQAEQKVIRHFITDAIFENLFCFHEPNFFQIDGNLGFVAGLNELLITEENGVIELLPAILPEYKTGKMENFLLKGAKISFTWRNSKVVSITSDKPIKVYNKHLSDTVQLSDTIALYRDEPSHA